MIPLKLAFFSLLLLVHGMGMAQAVPDNTRLLFKSRLIIKWAPLSMLDPDNTFQVGAEYLFAGRWGIQQEVGYGNYHFSLWQSQINGVDQNELEQKETWRTRLELRRYFRAFEQQRAPGLYAAGEILYKRVNWKEQERIGRNCDGGACAYFEDIDLPLAKDVVAVHLKMGIQWRLSNRVLLDVYHGFGGRWIHVKDVEGRLPVGGNSSFELITPSRPGSYTRVSMSLGIKIGYLLHR